MKGFTLPTERLIRLVTIERSSGNFVSFRWLLSVRIRYLSALFSPSILNEIREAGTYFRVFRISPRESVINYKQRDNQPRMAYTALSA